MKFRKKPVVIDAVKWGGDNFKDILDFCGGPFTVYKKENSNPTSIFIHTLEGEHEARLGDMIIRGVHGEYYPCKPDIFEKTYEPVE